MANTNNLTLALKIKADLTNALSNFKSLEKELQRTKTAGEQAGRGANAGAAGLNNLGKSADNVTSKLGKTRAGVQSISKQLESFRNQVYLFHSLSPISFSISALSKTADEYTNYQARIKLVSRSNQEAQGTFKALMDVANDTGQLFGATAELYTRVYRSLGANANSAEILQFTKTIQQAVVVSGASAQEASAALIQLSQGLASGTLRGEEFNSVSEQMPILLEILQKSLGKTRGELRKMAEDGGLTPQIILQATKEAREEIERQYAQMPKTIGRAINELSNSWLQFIGQTDNAMSASSIVASAISLLAQNLNLVGGAILVLGGIMGGRFIGQLKTAQTALKGMTGFFTVIRTQGLSAAASLVSVGQAGTLAGRGILALFGGPVGIAISATLGLVSAYQYLKAKEEELEAQFNQTALALDSNIAKTEGLIEARTQLGELGGFSDRVVQIDINTKAIEDAENQLAQLKARRDELLAQNQIDSFSGGLFNQEALAKTEQQITDLETKLKDLKGVNTELAQNVKEQYQAAFDAAIEAGGEMAEKLKALGSPEVEEAQKILQAIIKDSEAELLEMRGELSKVEKKLKSDITDATLTAGQKLEQFRDRAIASAKAAGDSGKLLQPLIDHLNTVIGLQKEFENAKTAKENDKYFADLSKRARQAKMTSKERLIDDIKSREGATAEQIAQGIKDAQAIENGENYRKSLGKKPKKEKYDAESKNLQLNVQYLRLTGQEVKANLTDIQGRYNQLLAEFTKHSNVDGINLIKKILPLEEAKVQIDGIQAEINKLFSNQSAQEQRIQAQVQTGLITHLEGQRQLKDIYAQTVAEIEKQLPLLEKLAQMPGTQGEQARALLEQMKLKISELKSAENDLEKAFKDGLTQGIQSSLMGLAQGTMTLRDAIKNLALTVINAMAQIAAQQLAMQASSAISGLFGGAASAAGTVTAATGGYIRGAGTGTSDSIPARLSNGEYVVRAAAVSRYGVDFLHALNRGQLRKFSAGGLVSQPPVPSYREPDVSTSMLESRNQQTVASPVNIQQTLAVDSAELFTAGINTVAGARAVLTVIRANKQTLKQELS